MGSVVGERLARLIERATDEKLPLIIISGSGGGARMRGPWAGGGGREEAGTDRRSLWLQRAGRPESVSVRTGISDGSSTEIVEGDVHEGDLLIVDASTNGQPSSSSNAGGPPGGGMRRIF